MVRSKVDSRVLAERGVPGKPPTATYQTRIRDYSGIERAVGDAALSDYAELFARMERKLFAEVAAGTAGSVAEERVPEAVRHTGSGCSTRVRVSLEGKVASVKEQQKLRVGQLRGDASPLPRV